MSKYIEKIYSKINPTELLHIIIHKQAFNDADFRINVCDDKETLQLAILNLKCQQTFKAHKHINKEYNTNTHLPAESWVVLNGSVIFMMYDLDDSLLKEVILDECDISFTLKGGHNYLALTDDTCVAEFKAGPYLGVKYDKVFI